MKKLPNKFRKYGFNYIVLKRVGDVAILKKSAKMSEGMVNGYEVIKVRSMKRIITPKGYSIEEKETIPSSGQFGNYGWDYEHYENAVKKFNHLIRGED